MWCKALCPHGGSPSNTGSYPEVFIHPIQHFLQSSCMTRTGEKLLPLVGENEKVLFDVLFSPRENRFVWHVRTLKHTSKGDKLLHHLHVKKAMPSRNYILSNTFMWIYLDYICVCIPPSSSQFYLWSSPFLKAGYSQQSLLCAIYKDNFSDKLLLLLEMNQC